MKIIFFIKSSTVDVSRFNIKDVPGSSGRLDVISRCILSAILNENKFDENVEIWTFLDKYGVLIFDTKSLNYIFFPKNELMLSFYIVKLIKDKIANTLDLFNPLNSVQILDLDITEAIERFKMKGYDIYVLKENGKDFMKFFENIKLKNNIVFIIGNQVGEYLDSIELLRMNVISLSFGFQSYLASSVIRLIKIHFLI